MRRVSGLFGGLILVFAIASCGGSTGPGGGGGGGGGGGDCPANTFCMTISNTFNPKTLTVAPGTTISWENDSGTLHNVLWDTQAGSDAALPGDGAGDIGQSTSGTHTRIFNTAGTYAFTCTLHPGMKGTLTVQ